MRLVFAGTPEVAVPALDGLLASRHEVVAVVTRPDAPAGRGRVPRRSPVGERADAAGLEVLSPASPSDPDFLRRLVELEPECCPVVAYGALLRPAALEIPQHGWVNLHFSLLPAWRGAAPVQRAVLAGDDVTGAATFRIVEELDAGPVFGMLTEEVRPRDTSGDLLRRLATSGAELLARTIDGIESGELSPRPQPQTGVSLAPKLLVDDAQVDWSAPAMRVDRLVRACTPAPGAWTTYRGERLKLGPVVSDGQAPRLAPGELAADKRRVLVGTATDAVELTEVQQRGKRQMSAVEWARGTRLEPGERVGE